MPLFYWMQIFWYEYCGNLEMFIVWSSNPGIMGSANVESIEGVQKTNFKTQGFESSFDDKHANPSAIVSINNYAKSYLLENPNLNSLQVQPILNALGINREDSGQAIDPIAISNVCQHIIKEFR